MNVDGFTCSPIFDPSSDCWKGRLYNGKPWIYWPKRMGFLVTFPSNRFQLTQQEHVGIAQWPIDLVNPMPQIIPVANHLEVHPTSVAINNTNSKTTLSGCTLQVALNTRSLHRCTVCPEPRPLSSRLDGAGGAAWPYPAGRPHSEWQH